MRYFCRGGRCSAADPRAALTDGQFDALIPLTFDILVPAEFVKGVWAGSRKLKGLVRRQKAEARLGACPGFVER